MTKAPPHKWEFAARFRRGAFGWKSQPAIQRIKQAVSEIKAMVRKDPVLAAEGAVKFLEKLVPAIESVDSSSGSIGTAVSNAIDALVPIIAKAPWDPESRDKCLDRLWEAFQDDGYCYLESIGDAWGELCGSAEVASRWADSLLFPLRSCWSDPRPGAYFTGTSACLSSLVAAGRFTEILDLLALRPNTIWSFRAFGVQALAALGRTREALEYTKATPGLNDSPYEIARSCEEILLAAGQRDDAYRNHAVLANTKTTNVATFKAIAAKYPERSKGEILKDCAKCTPGDEGKWFAAAKDAGLLVEALDLARRSPCDPKTLNRAARDFAETDPRFALEVALTSLHWLALGFGYEVSSSDVGAAYDSAMKSAKILGLEDAATKAVEDLLGRQGTGYDFLRTSLAYRLRG